MKEKLLSKGFTEITDDPSTLPELNREVITFSTEFPQDGFVIEELIGNNQTNKSGVAWSKSYIVTHWKAIK